MRPGRVRQPLDFSQEETHPVVLVNWEDAHAFCQWLTEREVKIDHLNEGQAYRLPPAGN